MLTMSELYAARKRKQELEQQLKNLAEDEKIAQSRLTDARVRCQKESLDIKKLESNEFRQFWFKLRGVYEEKQLENNARTTESMRLYHEAQEKVFELEQLHKKIQSELDGLKGIEEAFDKAYRLNLEHINYSLRRDELERLTHKLEDDDYQLRLLAGARNLIQLSVRKAAQLKAGLSGLAEPPAEDDAGNKESEARVDQVISMFSELRVLLTQLEQELGEVDSLETQTMRFTDVMKVEPVAIFYDRHFQGTVNPGALREALSIADGLADELSGCLNEVEHLTDEMESAYKEHEAQLQNFVSHVPLNK